MIEVYTDEYFMREALKEAEIAYDKGEVPVGAVIVLNKTIIARTHNLTEQLTDVTAHAEMQAITSASEYLGAKYLKKCTLYVTLEPCGMCCGALAWSQIDRIVYAATDERKKFMNENVYHPKTVVEHGLLAEQASKLVKDFFQQKRK
ncbi:nucleoside deaminase [Crocinitomix catalasitica]|uniref:nucleoside deaminase n=1 Tax=Crocinitomix catalasitica TaxID=184607 RepID=UPI000482C5AF|nr:nucleoside deaminase [Crocinitomix catalasitica]